MNLKVFFAIVEMRTKVISMSTIAIALCYTVYAGYHIEPLILCLLVIAVLCVDMGTTAFNTLFDFLKGTDDKSLNQEEDKVLVHQGVNSNDALWAGVACYSAAIVLGIVLGFLTDWRVVLIGAACMAVGFFYTAGPYPISRTPFGEIFAGGFLGPVLFCIVFYVFSGLISGRGGLISLPSFFIIASVLAANNACDIEGDTKNGRRTLAILLGPSRAKGVVYVLGILGFLLIAAYYYYDIVPSTIRFPLGAGLIGLFLVYRNMDSIGFSHETKSRIMKQMMLVVLIFTLTVVGGYLWWFLIQ